MSWAHVEAALDPSKKAVVSENSRLRHITQVYQALVDVGVPKIPMISHDLAVGPKRKQDVALHTTERPRRHKRIPGQYREITSDILMPLAPSDDDDDYTPDDEEDTGENKDEDEDEGGI